MSLVEKGFIPLPKVEQEQPEEKIMIALNLPQYVDQDRIGVNLTGISSLCKLGGINHLIISGYTEGETSQVTPEVAGFNPDGSAIASKKIAKTIVDTFDSQPESSLKSRRIAGRWIDLKINFNIDEIASRISDKPEGIRSVANWAKELDSGIKNPIRRNGNQNLLHKLEDKDKWDYAVATLASLFVNLRAGDYAPSSYIGYFMMMVVFYGIFDSAVTWKNDMSRSSLFVGFQVDRALALAVESRRKPLIKDIKEQ